MKKSFSQFLNENKGIEYEELVKKVLRKVTIGRPTKLRRASGAGSFSAHDTDMILNVNNVDYPIEIKANMRAQMGGISISYNYDTKEFDIKDKSSSLDDETKELIYEAIKRRSKDIDTALEWFRQNDKEIFSKNKSVGFPLRVSEKSWKKAIDDGVIKKLNDTIDYSTDFINSHYHSKNVNYMQIGKAGLFHLSRNPLKLDVPKLEGDISIEFRAGKSGLKVNKTEGYEYSTIVLRLQGRLAFKGKSNITLDDEKSATEFLNKVEV